MINPTQHKDKKIKRRNKSLSNDKFKMINITRWVSWLGTVAHDCNPSYSEGGNDQEDHISILVCGKSYGDPHLNKEAGCGITLLSSQLHTRK
jgi:hypothetical protein